MSLKRIDHSIDISLASAEAYREWTEFTQFPVFMEALTRVTVIDSVRSRWVFEVAGLDWEFDAVITAREPGRLLEWTTTSGEVALAGRAEFEPLSEDSCRLTVSIDWSPHGPVEHIGSLFGDDSRILKRELENFRQYVEADALDSLPDTRR